jgi:hypothetical protein
VITILARKILSHDFIALKAEMGIKELGNDVYSKLKYFALLRPRRYVVSEQAHLRHTDFRTDLL